MSSIIFETVNALQDIHMHITGITNAPSLEDTPTSLDTLILPCAITRITRGSEWSLEAEAGMVKMTITVTVYLQAFSQDYLGNILTDTHRLMDALRDKYRDEATYLYNDGQKMILDRDGLQAWINQGVAMRVSGYRADLQYPERSGNFYHGFEVTFGVVGNDGEC